MQPCRRTIRMAQPASKAPRTVLGCRRPLPPCNALPPCIILVEPTMGENIGAAARAMKNFGLRDLRLVAPRDGWPNSRAEATSVGAIDLLHAAKLYGTLAEAVADLQYVYAATARPRYQTKPCISSRQLPVDYPADGDTAVGFCFGRESSGLTNEEVAMAHKVISVDADPSFPVLNLAQAVLLVCYELYRCPVLQGGGSPGDAQAPQQPSPWGPPGAWATVAGGSGSASSQQMATQGELEGLMGRTFAELEDSGFFEERNKDESVRMSIRNLALRVDGLSKADLALLHGMLSKLAATGRQWRQQPPPPTTQ